MILNFHFTKKMPLILILLLLSFTGFSKASLEGFESPITPKGVPANWVRFQNAITGPFSFNTLIVNDECSGAITIPVNQNTNCLQTVQGSLAFATGSPNVSSCDGTIDDDDVWFSFTATSTIHYISLLGVNYSDTPSGLKYSVFKGTCEALTQLGGCTLNSSLSPNPPLDGLTIGTTYYLRVYSSGTTSATTTFEICIGTKVGTCATALPLCAISPIIIPNNVGVADLPNPISPYSTTNPVVGCLDTAPSPTFYYFQVPANGNYSFLLEQNTNTNFAPASGIDIDFVTWGPYVSNAAACAAISTSNTRTANSTLSCSYSITASEIFGVNNAIAGQIYIIMITNYDGRKGFIRITQRTGPVPTACCPFGNFTYSKNFYCQNDANPTPRFISNAVAGTFSAVPATGLSINPVTGLINLAASTPGTYIVKNTISASGLCPSDSDSWSISINALPIATFSYAGSPYCKNGTTIPSPTLGFGGISGTFTSTTGLSINATTGAINLADSTAGTYTVTNTIAASGGCSEVVATAQVTITNVPQATIAYSDPFYCYNNTGSQAVTLTGTTGGTFSASPTGLSISSTSGAFNVSTSPARPYTVTYTMAAAGGCPQATATTTVIIIPQINVQLSAVCVGPDFTITALPVAGSFNPANATYEWSGPNGYTFGPTSNPSIVIGTSGTYTSTVTVNGCRYVTTQQVDGIACTIQKGISPNGDGDNEAFILSEVKSLSIFNRYGAKVYSHGENYTNQWRGQSESGSELPDGTYYYVITRNSGNSFTGWIYINR
jgi:gliding motility-associated-like protein